MASEVEKKAREAFFDDDFGVAVDLYSQAIHLDPNNADLFADRAQAHIKLNCFTGPYSLSLSFHLSMHFHPYHTLLTSLSITHFPLPEAVSDANKAIQLNSSLAKAYLRKGYVLIYFTLFSNSVYAASIDSMDIYRTACIKLEEYHTAKLALQSGASFAPNDSRFTKLIEQCDQHIAG